MHATDPKPQTRGTVADRTLYARKDIEARGGPKKSHLYGLIEQGRFPAPLVRLGPRYTRWSAHDVESWLADPARWIAEHVASPEAA